MEHVPTFACSPHFLVTFATLPFTPRVPLPCFSARSVFLSLIPLFLIQQSNRLLGVPFPCSLSIYARFSFCAPTLYLALASHACILRMQSSRAPLVRISSLRATHACVDFLLASLLALLSISRSPTHRPICTLDLFHARAPRSLIAPTNFHLLMQHNSNPSHITLNHMLHRCRSNDGRSR
jgi:hypothetical protein